MKSEERITIATDVSLAGNEKDLGVFAIAQAVDQLASRGARAYGISVRIMLPTFAYESRLKAMMVEISEICKEKRSQGFLCRCAKCKWDPDEYCSCNSTR